MTNPKPRTWPELLAMEKEITNAMRLEWLRNVDHMSRKEVSDDYGVNRSTLFRLSRELGHEWRAMEKPGPVKDGADPVRLEQMEAARTKQQFIDRIKAKLTTEQRVAVSRAEAAGMTPAYAISEVLMLARRAEQGARV